MGFPQYFTYSAMVSGLSGIFFYSLLIKPLGVPGVALGKLCSMVFTTGYYIYIVNKRLSISPASILKICSIPLLSALVVCAGWGIFSYYVTNVFVLIGECIAAVLTFLTLIWIAGVFDKTEKALILNYSKTSMMKLWNYR
jgi:peptidoglycan biosynthesis protein MviN/MurJ (putative lipid II flippase)